MASTTSKGSIRNKLNIGDLALKGKRVLMRVDFNVPFGNGQVKDKQHIEGTLPTIKYALDKGAKSVIFMSHLGRASAKKRLLGKDVTFLNDCAGEEVERAVGESDSGQIILLENLRFHLEEEGSVKDKQGNKIKADKDAVDKFRASLYQNLVIFYFNGAFGAAHRAHSSIVGVKLDQRAAGYLMKKELDYFGRVLENSERPFLAILAKVSDKIQLIENLLDKVNGLIIGGDMAFTFLMEKENMKIGKSLFDTKRSKSIQQILDEAKAKNVEIYLPVDFIVAHDIKSTETKEATKENVVAEQTKQNTITIIDGGDTATVRAKFGFVDQMSHVSTGGGASLELLEGKDLPGVTGLSDKLLLLIKYFLLSSLRSSIHSFYC
ncbi:unnamed protein product [Rotaria magnacalcarata]|uniref:Phosphoglycerate kinase n=2 Tax=Rotaria magnacalcarata TaxID=392030 RepID=A0A816ZKY5_9BILA|nr:unnamed protein product [Rotaria magnacalcarata]